jgi:hypothetical protein
MQRQARLSEHEMGGRRAYSTYGMSGVHLRQFGLWLRYLMGAGRLVRVNGRDGD